MQNTERQLFATKWPVVERAVKYHGSRRLRMSPEDIDDVTQMAAVLLLRTIARKVPSINGEWVARAALSSRASKNKRRHVSLDDWNGVQAAPEASVLVDGVIVTVADATMDSPELVALWRDGMHGRSRPQAGHQSAAGVSAGGRVGRAGVPSAGACAAGMEIPRND